MNILGTLTVMMGVNTAGLSRAAVNMKRFETQVLNSNGRIQASFAAVGSQMALTGAMTTQYLTVPLGILGGVATKTFADFEYSLAKVTGLVGVAADTVQDWGNRMLDMSAEVGQTPKKLGDALYYITTSGLRGAESMEVLRHSALTAAAGLGDARVVADALTSAINAYGKENITARHATDVLIAGIREAKTEPEQFASSIGKVFPVAAQLGASFEDVSAGLASMTRTGTKAAEAATYLRRMFFTLIQEPPKAEAELNKLGLSFESLRDTLRNKGLLPMLLELKEKVGDNVTIFGDIFPNIRALIGVLDILGPNLENNKDIFDALGKTAGTFNHAIGSVEKTVTFRWKKAMAGLSVSMVKLGAVIKDPVINLIQNLSNYIQTLIGRFTSLDQQTQQNILLWAGIGAALGPVLLLMGALITSLKTILGLFLGKTLMAWTAQLLIFGAAIYYAAKNWDLLTKAVENHIEKNYMVGLSRQIQRIKANFDDASSAWEGFINKLDASPAVNQYKQLTEQIQQLQGEMATTPENLHDEREDIYNKIVERLKEMETVRAKLLKQGVEEFSMTARQYNALEKTHEKMFEWQRRLASADVDISLFKESTDDAINFKDLASKMLDDFTTDIGKVGDAIKNKLNLNGLFAGVGGGFEIGELLGNVRELDNDLDLKIKTYIKLDIGNDPKQQLDDDLSKIANDWLQQDHRMAIYVDVITAVNKLPFKPEQEDKGTSNFAMEYAENLPNVQEILSGVTADMQVNAEAAERLGSMYDKVGTDTDILSAALQKLTAPDALSMMSDDQIDKVRQMIVVYEELAKKQKEGLDATNEWKRAFSSFGTLMGSLSKYMSEGMASFVQAVSEGARVIGQLLNFINSLTALLEKLNLIKKTSALLTTAEAGAETKKAIATASGIPVTLGAAAAEGVKAEASTTAAIAGAASSTAWIPIVGVALALAGIIAITAAMKNAKSSTGLKEGGVIPAGYPNDSFPAMLSSGEMVVPQNKTKEFLDIITKNETVSNANTSNENITNKVLSNKTVQSYEDIMGISTTVNETAKNSMVGNVPKMKDGGLIPQGFPNDTYLTYLSSGELVIPANKTNEVLSTLNGGRSADKVNETANDIANNSSIINKVLQYTNSLNSNKENKVLQGANIINTSKTSNQNASKFGGVQNFVNGQSKNYQNFSNIFGKTLNTSNTNSAIGDSINIGSPSYSISPSINAAVASSDKTNAVALSTGGIIPSGYPNDTFPAMLSSNEAVIPLSKLQKMIHGTGGEQKEQKVTFVLKGRTMEAVMYAQGKVTQAY